MVEEFIKSNYQLLFWLVILVVVAIAVFWFFRRTSSKAKDKKNKKEALNSERKEIIFELVKGKKETGFSEKEIADFLDIKEEEAHSHLLELIREEKIIMDKDLGQIPRYIYKEQ